MLEIDWDSLQQGLDTIKARMHKKGVLSQSMQSVNSIATPPLVVSSTKNLCGRNIQCLRKKLHLTQDDVAAVFAVDFGIDSFDQSTLARVENGQRYLRDYELLIIATILSVSIEDLLVGEPIECCG